MTADGRPPDLRPGTEVDALLRKAFAHLEARGLRRTRPREVIFRMALASSGPFDAEQLLERSRRVDGLVSLTTVYRTLPLLLETGLVQEIELEHEKRHYQVCRDRSDCPIHLVCLDCRKVFEGDKEGLRLEDVVPADDHGLVPARGSLRIEGRCRALLATGSCRHLGGG